MLVISSVVATVLIVLIVAWQSALLARRRPRRPVAADAWQADDFAFDAAPTTVVVAGDPLSRLVEVLRRRKWARRSLSLLSFGLIAVAVGMIGYPFYTNLVQTRIQARLDKELSTPEIREAYLERRVEVGDSLTRIRIPKLDVDVVVVEGTTASALRAGAGHYASTPLPCENGNVGIAGHRTTYGKPFANVDLLQPGDEIILETPIGVCTYRVARDPFVVKPNDITVVADTPTPQLTLTTCHPKGSAKQRLIIRAELVSEEPTQA